MPTGPTNPPTSTTPWVETRATITAEVDDIRDALVLIDDHAGRGHLTSATLQPTINTEGSWTVTIHTATQTGPTG